MSVRRKTATSTLGPTRVTVPAAAATPSTGWTRPTDWLPTTVTAGEQQIQLLILVAPGFTQHTMTVTAPSGYTVDWGDGSATENKSNNVRCYHTYDYTALASGTLTSEGFRQALLTVTPQAGNLTGINIGGPYTTSRNYQTNAVEIVFGPPTITAPVFSSQRFVRRVAFLSPVTVNCASLFSSMYGLREVSGTIANSGTDFSSMFASCQALTSVPALNTASGTNFTNMFSGCQALTSIPALDTASGTNFSSMFGNCQALPSIPALNTASGINFTNMFTSCNALTSIPALDTASGTNFNGMFTGCYSLAHIAGTLDCHGGTSSSSFTGMFSNCNSLQKVAFSAGNGPAYTFTLAQTELDAATLNAIYTALPTVTGQTLTITGIYGGDTDDPSIATAKGWTVTGP